jgi:phage host-nuclease inhibitor protein Gam
MSNVHDLVAAAERTQPDLAPEELAYGGDDVERGWAIENVQSLDWALARVAALRAEVTTVDELERAAIARVKQRAEALRARAGRGIRFFEFQIEGYAQRNRPALLGGGKRKSRALINGTVGWRAKNTGGRLKVEDPKALEPWLLASPVEAGFYRTKTEAEMKTLQAHFKATGEIPPGCRVEEETETFYVETDAPEAALAKE